MRRGGSAQGGELSPEISRWQSPLPQSSPLHPASGTSPRPTFSCQPSRSHPPPSCLRCPPVSSSITVHPQGCTSLMIRCWILVLCGSSPPSTAPPSPSEAPSRFKAEWLLTTNIVFFVKCPHPLLLQLLFIGSTQGGYFTLCSV